MGKSKFVFLIMFFGYIAIAILNAFNITSVGDEILLGLSLCALTMSLSDSFSIIKAISLMIMFRTIILSTTPLSFLMLDSLPLPTV